MNAYVWELAILERCATFPNIEPDSLERVQRRIAELRREIGVRS